MKNEPLHLSLLPTCEWRLYVGLNQRGLALPTL